MSLLGDSFDNFLTTIDYIIQIILSFLSGLEGIITGIFNLFNIFVSFLYYIYLFLAVVVEFLINPSCLLLILLGSSFYYAAFLAETRKDMLIKFGVFWKYVGETSAKILMSAYTIVTKFITGIIDMI